MPFSMHEVGRRIGSPNSTTDALSPQAQGKRGFKVEPLLTSCGVARDHIYSTADRRRHIEFEERLQDNTRSPVPVQAAFRIDFPDFLGGLGRRDRELARFLALGHSGQAAAAKFLFVGGPHFAIAAGVAGTMAPMPGAKPWSIRSKASAEFL